jgi:hypothetical protein
MTKETRINGQQVTLTSTDGKRWFSSPSELLAYQRRRAEEDASLRAELQGWFERRFKYGY